MRPLEGILLLALAVTPVMLTRFRQPWVWLAAVLGASAGHLVLEGWRWQLVPAYVLVLLLVGVAWWRQRRAAAPGRWGRMLAALAGGLLLALAAFLGWGFPVPRFPAPTGPYAVGTVTFTWTDSGREEWNTPTAGDPRRLNVQIWYPTSPTAARGTAPYLAHAEVLAPALADFLGLPRFMLGHLRLIRTPATPEAPPAEGGPFPVVVFSHGWSGFRQQDTMLALELAAHGFVVVAPDHTYGAVATVFPDGEVALNNPDALPRGDRAAAQRVVATWTADLAFVVTQLEALNQTSGPWQGRLDLTRVGVMGHSTGGGTAAQFCIQWPPCRGALLLDPWIYPMADEALTQGTSAPVLILRTERALGPQNRPYLDRLWAALQGPAWDVVVQGAGHQDFSDLPMLSPLAARLGLRGPIPGDRMTLILRSETLAFFRRVLTDATEPLPTFPEALVVRQRP